MQLVNLSFAILVMKISFCVLPGVLGIYLLASSEESKRSLRNSFWQRGKVFGVKQRDRLSEISHLSRSLGLYFGGILLRFLAPRQLVFLLLKRYF